MGALTQELLVRTRVHLSHYFVHFVAVSKLGQLASDILVPRRLFPTGWFQSNTGVPNQVPFRIILLFVPSREPARNSTSFEKNGCNQGRIINGGRCTMHTGSSSKMPHRVEWTNQVVPVHIGKANYLLVPAANQLFRFQTNLFLVKMLRMVQNQKGTPFPVGGKGATHTHAHTHAHTHTWHIITL